MLAAEPWNELAPRVLGRAYGAVIALALVEDGGGSFVHTIGEPLRVVWNGETLDPCVLAREAGTSVEGVARLREILVAASVAPRKTDHPPRA